MIKIKLPTDFLTPETDFLIRFSNHEKAKKKLNLG